MADMIEPITMIATRGSSLAQVAAGLREVLAMLDGLSLDVAATHVQWALDLVEELTTPITA